MTNTLSFEKPIQSFVVATLVISFYFMSFSLSFSYLGA